MTAACLLSLAGAAALILSERRRNTREAREAEFRAEVVARLGAVMVGRIGA